MDSGGGQPWDDPNDRLSAIIKKMNEVFNGLVELLKYAVYRQLRDKAEAPGSAQRRLSPQYVGSVHQQQARR